MTITLDFNLFTGLLTLIFSVGIFLFAFQTFLLKGVEAMLEVKFKRNKEEMVKILSEDSDKKYQESKKI